MISQNELVERLRLVGKRGWTTSYEECAGDTMLRAADLIEEARNVLELHVAYEALRADRGGQWGPKGKAREAFILARDTLLSKLHQGGSHG